MRIAFIDHSFHQKTRSSRFLLDILEASGTVDLILDHSWDKTVPPDTTPFDPEGYDSVIIYQSHEFFRRLSKPHPNITFIPMYDAMVWRGQFYWHKDFTPAKVVSFSWTLHEEVLRRTSHSLHVQYYPDPALHTPPADLWAVGGGLRAFYWSRVKEIGPEMVFDLSRNHPFDQFTVHNAPDPSHEEGRVVAPPAHIRSLALTHWFASPEDYLAALQRHNVFFAPRPLEGIGMSFLEAMAMGQCVVAPDAPTMNEYIAHGTTGLLYPFPSTGRPPALDFRGARDMGVRARESVERGRARWLAGVPQMLDFIATPKSGLSRTITGWRRGGVEPIPAERPPLPEATVPVVSVVTVALNGGAALEETLRNVLGQTGIAFESVVLDGGSTDGSVAVLERLGPRLGYWHSHPDDGIFHAMNDAVTRCRGTWVVFMNVGDLFADEGALARLFACAPADADVIYGHHLYRDEAGVDRFRPAAGFDSTWARLQAGALNYDWLARIPAHQATAVRRTVLARLRFDPRYRLAADHDLLFRAYREQARFFHCDELIAVYDGTGQSKQAFRQCRAEWEAIARSHCLNEPAGTAGVARFFGKMAVHHAPAVRLAQALVTGGLNGLQRLHPGLAFRAREGLRLVRGLIRR